MSLSRLSLAFVVLLTLATRPMAAQVGSTAGIFAGVQYTGAALDLAGAAKTVKFGSGYGMHAGIGLGQTLSLVVNYDSNKLPTSGSSSTKLTQVDALARLHVFSGANSVMRPYLTAGVTARTAKGTSDFQGKAPTGGAGVTVQLPGLSVFATALWTFGNLTSSSSLISGKSSFSSTGTRVQVGTSFYLLGH